MGHTHNLTEEILSDQQEACYFDFFVLLGLFTLFVLILIMII